MKKKISELNGHRNQIRIVGIPFRLLPVNTEFMRNRAKFVKTDENIKMARMTNATKLANSAPHYFSANTLVHPLIVTVGKKGGVGGLGKKPTRSR